MSKTQSDTGNLQFDKFKSIIELIWNYVLFIIVSAYFLVETGWQYIFQAPMKSLKGEIILVTGAASGIGRKICLNMANLGATLICWDVQKDQNEETVAKLKYLGAKAFAFEVDLSDGAQVEVAARKVKQEVGEVTMIINNAGIMVCKEFLSHRTEELERTFQINVFAHFRILKEFLPGMIERNHGHVVAVASICGLVPTQNLIGYNASKAAVISYMETLRQEFRCYPKKRNIHFTTVYPLGCNTNMLDGLTCSNRFLLPLLTPDKVAERLIDGLRRNYENIYVPRYIVIVDCFLRCIPSKILTGALKISQFIVKPD